MTEVEAKEQVQEEKTNGLTYMNERYQMKEIAVAKVIEIGRKSHMQREFYRTKNLYTIIPKEELSLDAIIIYTALKDIQKAYEHKKGVHADLERLELFAKWILNELR